MFLCYDQKAPLNKSSFILSQGDEWDLCPPGNSDRRRPMTDPTQFGILLKHYRQSIGLTQEALAEMANLSPRTISDLERGINRSPRYATFELLADALSLSVQKRDLLKAALQPSIDLQPGREVDRPHQSLPLPPARLIGREKERIHALEMIRREGVRLLTLTGPSGVGKTRLALEVAQDLAPTFTNGSVFIPLAQLRDASLVPDVLAQTFRIREAASVSTSELVISFLQDKHLLLVLDNLEQILDCSPFIASLVANCPQLVLLTTSRTLLRLRVEQEYLLSPLPIDDAVALFCERIQLVRPDGYFPQEEVTSICEQLDCLPLALELAAMQGRLLSLSEIQKRLERRFELLRGGARDLPARQQTMEDAIAWSYELLSEPQQKCFRALSIFEGGWTLEAAEAVCWGADISPAETHLLTLAALVEASLVQTETTQSGIRFSMLELIREYARNHLRAAGEEEFCQYQHASYYARLAETAEALFDKGPADFVLSLAMELRNVQTALQWAEANREVELGLRLLGFARLWHVLGQPSQAVRWLERMLDLDRRSRENGMTAVPDWMRISKLISLGRVLLGSGNLDSAENATAEALDLSEQTGDKRGETSAWANLGMIAQASGKLRKAEEAFEKSAQHANLAGDDRLEYQAKVNLAEIARQHGNLSHASDLLEDALVSAKRLQMGWDVAIITSLVARLAYQQKNFPLAKDSFRESLMRLRIFGSPTFIAWCLEGCAEVLCEAGLFRTTTHLCAAATKMRKQAGTPLPVQERQAGSAALLPV